MGARRPLPPAPQSSPEASSLGASADSCAHAQFAFGIICRSRRGRRQECPRPGNLGINDGAVTGGTKPCPTHAAAGGPSWRAGEGAGGTSPCRGHGAGREDVGDRGREVLGAG